MLFAVGKHKRRENDVYVKRALFISEIYRVFSQDLHIFSENLKSFVFRANTTVETTRSMKTAGMNEVNDRTIIKINEGPLHSVYFRDANVVQFNFLSFLGEQHVNMEFLY